MKKKNCYPDRGTLARTEGQHGAKKGEQVNDYTEPPWADRLGAEVKQPAGTGEEGSETISATRDVIHRGAMNGMNNPEQRDPKRRAPGKARMDYLIVATSVEDWENSAKQQIKQKPAPDMENNIGQVITINIASPNEVIEAVGDVLDRTVVSRGGIEKKMVAERFEGEKGTFDHRVLANEIIVVPD